MRDRIQEQLGHENEGKFLSATCMQKPDKDNKVWRLNFEDVKDIAATPAAITWNFVGCVFAKSDDEQRSHGYGLPIRAFVCMLLRQSTAAIH